MEEKRGKMKNGILLAVTFLLLLFLIDGAVALGISPGRATFNFEPNVEKVVALTIVNTEHKAMNVSIRVEGEWAQFVELNQSYLEFAPEDESKSINYKIKFPSQISAGFDGIKAKIVVTEISNAQGTVSTKIAVEHQLYILTGKTRKIENKSNEKINITRIYTRNYTKGKEAIINIDISNPTEKTIEVYSTILVYDSYGSLRSEFNSTTETIDPNSSKTLEAFWNLNELELGNYGGKLLVYYDNEIFGQNLKIEIKEDAIFIEFGELKQEKQETVEQKENFFSETSLFLKNKTNLIIIVLIVVIIIITFILYLKYKKLSTMSDKKIAF
ncbi:MAG: hypothetical protein QXK80_00375 [Candidatus Pacearchaeota archaeon]